MEGPLYAVDHGTYTSLAKDPARIHHLETPREIRRQIVGGQDRFPTETLVFRRNISEKVDRELKNLTLDVHL